MPYIIDLSGTPHEEDCAQVGRDPSAGTRSHQEAIAYRAALIAVCGPAPDGYTLRIKANPHDFGTYYTVQLHRPDDEAQLAADYEILAEQGIGQWNAAMMPPPYAYRPDGSWTALDGVSPADAAIESALVASRPGRDDDFALPLFRQIHERLRAAYPKVAVLAEARIALIHTANAAPLP